MLYLQHDSVLKPCPMTECSISMLEKNRCRIAITNINTVCPAVSYLDDEFEV